MKKKSKKIQYSRKTLKRIIRYAIPHLGKILSVSALTALYSACLTMRIGLIGLLIDGVFLAGMGGSNESRALTAYRTVGNWLGMNLQFTPSYKKNDSFKVLVAKGRFKQKKKNKPYVAIEGELTDLWPSKPVPGKRGNGGFDRPFLRMEVQTKNNPEELEPGLWRFTDGKVKYTTGTVLNLKEKQTYINIFCVISLILAFAIGITSFTKDYFSRKVNLLIAADIRKDIYNHIIEQSVGFFDRHKSGDLISRFLNDANLLQLFIQNFFDFFLEQPFTIIFSLAVAFWVSPLFTALTIPFFLIIFYPVIHSGHRVKKHGRGRLKQLGVITEAIHQLFSGIRIIKAFGMEKQEKKRFLQKNDYYIRVAMKMEKAKITSRSTLEVLYNVGMAIMILAVGYLMAIDINNLGNFAMFLGAIVTIYRPMRRIARTYNNLQETLAGSERVFKIMDQKLEIIDPPDAITINSVKSGITFDHVTFQYNQDNNKVPVLDNISFTAKNGEVIAIVGPSGSGKTTIVDLISRFYEQQKGAILLDGIDIRNISQHSLFKQIAIVGQDPFLFNATIIDNLRYGREDASIEEIIKACKKAYIHDVIEKLPDGYETEIGERGAKLSGGERQRITIARALLKDTPILILDEATSSLDSEAEHLVQKAIQNLIKNRLTFIIAHRLSTITFADKIMVIENGRLVETGSHDKLIARKKAYWHLYSTQYPGEKQ